MKEKNIKTGFVILHYLAYEMTKKCVDNLLENFNKENILIVIVDNGSPNNSGMKLSNLYRNTKEVKVIQNKENLGFAKGNNIGYLYLINNYKLDYIIVMNNDVLIHDTEFINRIDEIYNRTAFYILGPDVYSPIAKIHQNPVSQKPLFNLGNIDNRIKYLEWVTSNFNINYFISHTYNRVVGKMERLFSSQTKKAPLYLEEQDDVMLHGSCYIFSELFLKEREYAFYPKTFLYFEEDILYLEASRNGYKMVYCPEIKVEHLEDVSTNLAYGTGNEKIKKKMCEQLKSARIYKELLEKNNEIIK